jgi:CheY-like chemotaxis protein
MTQRVASQTVIIAVGDPNILYLLRRYAEECGLETVSVSPCAAVPALARRIQPALIILDNSPPHASLGVLLRDLQAEPETHQTPVLIYSSFEETFDCWRPPAEPWTPGVEVYLPKSVKYDDFLAALAYTGVCNDTAHARE